MPKQPAARKSQPNRPSAAGNVDDLTRIEGIGPATAAVLAAAGIGDFQQLANLSVDELRTILRASPRRVATCNPSTWPRQSQLAAAGHWKQLRQWQQHLHRGAERKPATLPHPSATVLIDAGHRFGTARRFPLEKIPDTRSVADEYDRRRDDLASEYLRTQQACSRFRPRLESGDYGPVIHCDAALRRKLGRIVSPLQYVITVSVPYKIVRERLAWKRVQTIPDQFEGIPIKVTESRPYLLSTDPDGGLLHGLESAPSSVFPPSAQQFSETMLIGGLPCSVEGQSENWGTLGICFESEGALLAIVNAHFAPVIGETILQPPVNPFAPGGPQVIGRVTASGFLVDVPEGGTIDAALVGLDGQRDVHLSLMESLERQSAFPDAIFFAADRLTSSEHLLSVFKVGACTELTRGRIELSNFGQLEIAGRPTRNVIRFFSEQNQTLVDAGDSGSVLVARMDVGLLVLGVVFAGDRAYPQIGYACHFADIMAAFGLNIPNALPRAEWRFVA